MPRIQGLFERNNLNADAVIKSAPGFVFSFSVTWKGLTVGDIVCQLFDSVDAAGTSDPSKAVVTIYAATANGFAPRDWAQGKEFPTGIFYKEGPNGGGSGAILAELTAK
jgi:hypothetical protein